MSNFRKLESKFKKRNYRNQNSSSDNVEDSNDRTSLDPNIQEKSSSSESIQFQPEIKDSSDERSEVAEGTNLYSNSFTSNKLTIFINFILLIFQLNRRFNHY
jgi:hypothetical protein